MESMEHLSGEQGCAGIKTGRFKTARDRAEKARYNIIMNETKIISGACCGSRMFWFDKENPSALFADIRDGEHTLCDGRSLKVHPDIVSGFTGMPFLDEPFKLVVFDPPRLLKVGKDSWLAKKYGKLPEDWPRAVKKGIDGCFRVLEGYGVLIFKWNGDQITARKVLGAIGRKPLFGHTTGRHGKTTWMRFMKLPDNVRSKLTHGSLFSGIGGFGLGDGMAGIDTLRNYINEHLKE